MSLVLNLQFLMHLRRSKSEMGPRVRFDNCDTKSQHSTLDSIYSENSIIWKANGKEEIDQHSRDLCLPKPRSIYSDIRRTRSVVDNKSLYSVHSARSVFQRAQDNYQTIIGNDYPLTKVISIWKAICEHVGHQLNTDKSIVIPKLGFFTIIETNLKGYIHKKPVFIINKSLLKIHGLKSKDYGITKTNQKSILNYSDIANKCKANRFIIEEVTNEVIKSFEKLLMTKRNTELSFFQIGKLQVQACEIRMKFYEDFINVLNRSLFRSQSSCSLISGISKLSRTSSVLSRMTSRSGCYRPSADFCSALPFDNGLSEIKKETSECMPQARKSQSCYSQGNIYCIYH